MALALRLGLLATSARRASIASRPGMALTRTGVRTFAVGGDGFVDDATLLGLEKATLLDVRGVEGPGEVADDPPPKGAVNATWDTLNMGFVDPAKLPADKNAPVVVFWQKGGRASKAKAFLEQLGYSDVHNAGGVDRVKRMFGE